jgi:hypothetical protein
MRRVTLPPASNLGSYRQDRQEPRIGCHRTRFLYQTRLRRPPAQCQHLPFHRAPRSRRNHHHPQDESRPVSPILLLASSRKRERIVEPLYPAAQKDQSFTVRVGQFLQSFSNILPENEKEYLSRSIQQHKKISPPPCEIEESCGWGRFFRRVAC